MAKPDVEFMSDLRAAMSRRPSVMANLLLLAICAFFAVAILWANLAEIDQVSRGEGRVMPSKRVQVVQNLEGGIVSELNVSEGAVVKAGQVLMQLDDTQFSSEYLENRMKFSGFEAMVARLQSEIAGTGLKLPPEIERQWPDLARGERELFASRAAELNSSVDKLRARLVQNRQEVAETQAKIAQLAKSLDLARQEIRILEPLVAKGINAPIELIRLRREESQFMGDLAVARESVTRQTAAIDETQQEIREVRAQFLSRALKELNEARVDMEALRQNLASRNDKLRRTVIRAPVTGTIKQLFVNTIGGVVRPGMDLLEIVPAEDTLVIEARIRPSDIAFIRPGARATVKFTAYDYTIYGAIPARLDQISADTIADEKTGDRFYMVRVTAKAEDLVDRGGKALPIIPGMTADVDVMTGKRTVLQYLLKPFNKASERALRES